MATVPQHAGLQARPGTLPAGSVVRIGAYTVVIERFLSEGGYAHVYVVRSSTPIPPTRDGALQHVLKRIVVPDKTALQAVRKEVDIMKLLRGHPHIVRIIEATASELGAGKGYEVYILMEYVHGGGIIDMMNTRLRNRLTESEILTIFSDTVDAVSHMHSQRPPLVHRDLKIENILMASTSCYKLCDFGSTTVAMTEAPQSSTEIQKLENDLNMTTTLQYRAPEMCDVWSRRPIGTAADIWALGVFLYKLCFYTTPFEESGMLAIQNATYRMPDHPPYSAALRNLIASMLQEAIAARPSIEELQRTVAGLRGRSPLSGREPALRSRPPASVGAPPETSFASVLTEAHVKDVKGYESLAPQITPMRRGRPGASKTAPAQPTTSLWPTSSDATTSPVSAFGDHFAPTTSAESGKVIAKAESEPATGRRPAAASSARTLTSTSPPTPSRPLTPLLASGQDVASRPTIQLGQGPLSRFTDTPEFVNGIHQSPSDSKLHRRRHRKSGSLSSDSEDDVQQLPGMSTASLDAVSTAPLTERLSLAAARFPDLDSQPPASISSSSTPAITSDDTTSDTQPETYSRIAHHRNNGQQPPDLSRGSGPRAERKTAVPDLIDEANDSMTSVASLQPDRLSETIANGSVPSVRPARPQTPPLPARPHLPAKPEQLKSSPRTSLPAVVSPDSSSSSSSRQVPAVTSSPRPLASEEPRFVGSTSQALESDSSDDEDLVPGGGNFDLPKALSSIARFAPRPNAPLPTKSRTAPPIMSPVAQPASSRKAITALVSQYEQAASGPGRVPSRQPERGASVMPSKTSDGGSHLGRTDTVAPTRKILGPRVLPSGAEVVHPVTDDEPAFEGVNHMKRLWETRGKR